jgi:hypothetical protein
MSPETLRMVYFVYIHSIMSYGLIVWGNQPYSDKIIKFKKRMIRIITNSRMRDSSRELFKKLEVLPLDSQYISSISIYMIKTNIYLTQRSRSTVSTQDLKPTYIHPQLIQQSSKRHFTTQQLIFLTAFLTISEV